MRLPVALTPRTRSVPDEQPPDPGVRRLQRRVRRAEARVAALEARVTALAEELTDARYQGRRAAEIADLVTELLSNEASRRDPEFVRILERYTGVR